MWRKSTMVRFLCLLGAVIASFGALNATAPPAEALWCAYTFLGCEYTHAEVIGEYACCLYRCSDGSQKIGVCEHLIPLPTW